MKIDEVFRDRGRLFWVLNIAGWTGYMLAAWLGALAHEKPESFFAVIVAAAISGFIGTIPLRYLYRRLWSRSVFVLGSAMLGASYFVAFFWQWLRNVLYYDWVKNSWEPEHVMDYVGGVIGSFYIMLCWSGLYFGIKYYHLLQEERARGLKSEAMAHEAQLKMLRYQLNPHFLFNTLNAISTLVLDKQNQMANTMVTRLSHFLRYSLDNDPMAKVTLAQEIEAMRLYLDIEKVRFAERLRLSFDIESQAERALIPSLLLQPLVENAIKYAIAQSVNGGAICISARVFAGELLLEVADDGPGMDTAVQPKHKRNGVGLANTRERLHELYGENQSFALSKTEPHGLTINIRIPLEVSEQAVAA